MKIQNTAGGEIDTKDMTDAESEIFEAVDKLYQVCNKYNKTMVTRVVLGGDKFAGGQNIADIKDAEARFNNLMDLFYSIDLFLKQGTNGMAKVSFDNPPTKE